MRHAIPSAVLAKGLLFGLVLLLSGCLSPRLMKTPNLYLPKEAHPFDDVPKALQTPYMEVVFATDRFPEQAGANQPVSFGRQRSNHLHVGTCRVQVGKYTTWEQLVEASTTAGRSGAQALTISEPDVKLRYPGNYWRAARIDDPSRDYADYMKRRAVAREDLYNLLRPMLAKTPRKEVFLYVHGVANSFADAVETTGEMWHFAGRQGVPISYSWPAGASGLLRGYTTDRESSEFTIFHLKMLLEDLAAMPEIEGISILAHSRGTDVTITAVRELCIAARGGDKNPAKALKLKNVVLASSDIDMEVGGQRITSERLYEGMDQLTIYLNKSDMALRISSWLQGSFARLGVIDVAHFTPQEAEAASSMGNLSIVQASVKTDFIGHSYFHQNPAVSSDLVLLFRDQKKPGAENGRPMEQVGENVWRITDSYPLVEKDIFSSMKDKITGTAPKLKTGAKQPGT